MLISVTLSSVPTGDVSSLPMMLQELEDLELEMNALLRLRAQR